MAYNEISEEFMTLWQMKLHCSEEMNKYTGERGEKQKKDIDIDM